MVHMTDANIQHKSTKNG